MDDEDLLTLGQAAEAFGIHRNKLARWVRSGSLTTYRSARDLREKLVKRSDVAALLAPRRIVPGSEQGKAAA
jgi:excisionase family DNA binding protein